MSHPSLFPSPSTFSLCLPQILLSIALVYTAIHVLRVYWRLRHIPGPFWGRITNLPRVWWVNTSRAHEIHQRLHEEYGDVVRFGPNMVSLRDPAWIPTVYPSRMGVKKSDFYRTLAPYTPSGALPAVFSSRDEEVHKGLRGPIAPLYSMSRVLPLEVFVDRTMDVLVRQLDERFAGAGEIFDLASWLQFFAFDVMGTLTFSKRYGFLEKGTDVHGMLDTIWRFLKDSAPFTQIPWVDKVWNKNALATRIKGATGLSILGIVGKFVAERQEETKAGKVDGNGDRDMLSLFVEIQKGNQLPPWFVTAWTFSNITAGSDSAAVVMRTVFYNLLSHPSTLEKLRSELLSAGPLTQPYPSWKDVCGLPYLDACILEALRLHPPFCLPFERIVPRGGMMLGDNYFPEGTVVGMSPWVVNRHKPTFGEDADAWNPERWMVSKELKSKREAAVLTFGAGRRVCLGRHIAMLELKKIVPALVLRYDFELIDPARLKVENFWFFRQQGMDVRVRRRVQEDVSI
ncbi:cytochrome P450 [Aspergillus desertorum]